MLGQLFSFAFRPQIIKLPRPIAVKLCQMMENTENKWSFKNYVQKFRCPPNKKCGSSQNSKIGAQFSVLRWITLGPVEITWPNLSMWCAARQGWKFGYKFFRGPASKRPKFGIISDTLRTEFQPPKMSPQSNLRCWATSRGFWTKFLVFHILHHYIYMCKK